MGVVITGVGLLTPLGASRELSWQRLLHPQPQFFSSTDPGFLIPDHALQRPENSTRLEQIALQVARETLADAGLSESPLLHSPRFGCVVGTSKGPLEEYRRTEDRTEPQPSLDFSQLWPSGPSSRLIQEYGLTGPALCPVSACATGLDAVLRGVRLIEQGDCDYVLAGSVDASLNDYVLHSYRRLGVLADRHLPFPQACQPFDVHRSGFVMGEGGAMFLLAREDLPALERERSYARWLGGESACDPTGLTQLDPSGQSLKHLLGNLIVHSATATHQIDLLHLHGTGTPANDRAEAAAISGIFGPPDQQPWSTASKGAHGHALGAAGSIELAWLLLSLRDGLIPAIQNLRELDPQCPIRPVLHRCVEQPVHRGLKVSLGFGGHQIACLFERGVRPAQHKPAKIDHVTT